MHVKGDTANEKGHNDLIEPSPNLSDSERAKSPRSKLSKRQCKNHRSECYNKNEKTILVCKILLAGSMTLVSKMRTKSDRSMIGMSNTVVHNSQAGSVVSVDCIEKSLCRSQKHRPVISSVEDRYPEMLHYSMCLLPDQSGHYDDEVVKPVEK